MNIQLFNRKVFSGILVAVIAVFSAGQGQAQVPDWPDLYDPLQFHTFYFDLDAGDAAAIQDDDSNSIEVPACFRAAGPACWKYPMKYSSRMVGHCRLPAISLWFTRTEGFNTLTT